MLPCFPWAWFSRPGCCLYTVLGVPRVSALSERQCVASDCPGVSPVGDSCLVTLALFLLMCALCVCVCGMLPRVATASQDCSCLFLLFVWCLESPLLGEGRGVTLVHSCSGVLSFGRVWVSFRSPGSEGVNLDFCHLAPWGCGSEAEADG